MKFKRRIFSLMLVLVMIFTSLTLQAQATETENDGTFSDVEEGNWAYEYIKIMSQLGIISGYGDGKFYPEERVSKEQFAKMLVLTLQLDLINPSSPSFIDVKPADWSYKYVETAKAYLTGYGNEYRPKSDAEREDMAYAVVKGLGLSVEGVDTSVLDQFSDKGEISTVLVPYVAKAVEEGIMVGSNGSFSPRGTLKRNEAATLLGRLIATEKVIYNDEKTTYDGAVLEEKSKTPTLTATVKEDKVYLDWTGVDSSGFKYYKVVASVGNEAPIYPTDGYVQAIGDVYNTDTYIKPNQNVNNGDTSSLIPGKKYHISITAVYDDVKYASNTVEVVIPDAEPISEAGRTAKLSYTISDGGIKLNWTSTESSDFKYYKVVFSKTDSTPVYPGDGYLAYISNASDSDYFAYSGQGYNGNQIDKLTSGQKYYISITAVYNNGDKYYPSNTITVTLP